ncbi:MAG: CcoQ/FixQ family Cbb3-type cytochrome c oxidase assembly chaperone [Bacteroidetes bacterium B1(2017)]|nr:MAG: CcoQ/FixQ family Cbb3-type cytochrome c oxidase assembly chaperone [Bacteroidetes bacterium B1(2017)]
MFKQHIQSMVGIESGYLIFSLIVFMTFFVGVLWWVFKADKNYIKDMGNKPFEN